MVKLHTGMKQIRRDLSSGFTLIELLVVIAIIAIIASISLLVANRVTEGGRVSQTSNILKTLDQVLTQSAADNESGKTPYKYTDETAQKNEYPIVDGRLNSAGVNETDAAEPTLQLFLLATGESASLLSMLNGIEGTFRNSSGGRGRLVESAPVFSPAFSTNVQRKDNTDAQVPLVRDPWGNAIRFVHPRFAGGHGNFYRQNAGTWSSATRSALQVTNVMRNNAATTVEYRRSYRPFDPSTAPGSPVGDADEGLTAGTRPYFYSPGSDNDPGTRDDNVYTDRPSFPSETKSAQ